MSGARLVEAEFHVERGSRGEKRICRGPSPVGEPCRIPRVARLMALAIRFDKLIRDGVITDQAELARLGGVTRARITQIMNLLQLAPDIQEQILFLPRVTAGTDPIILAQLQPIARELDWGRQRLLWRALAPGCVSMRD